MLKITVIVCLTVLVLIIPCSAIELDEVIERQSEVVDLERVEDAAKPYFDSFTPENADLNEGLKILLTEGREEVRGVFKKALRSCTMLLSVVLLCGIAGSVSEESKLGQFSAVTMAGVLAITAIAVLDVKSLLGLGQNTLERVTEFVNVLFPAVTALTAVTGSITGAAVKEMTAILFSDLLLNLMNHVLVPAVYAFLAINVAYAAVRNEGLKRVAGFLKWMIGITLTVLLTAFVGYLSVSGVIVGQTDAIAVKAAKLTLSSVIPVVGGILSDAAETVLAGAGILRGTVGVFGMLTILAICLSPFLQLGINYLMYKLTAALTATVADSGLSGLIESIGTAFGLILGMIGAGTLSLLIALISILSVMNI